MPSNDGLRLTESTDAPPGVGAATVPPVVGLDDAAARRGDLAGAKAAALARARAGGLPVLDGFVLTVPAVARGGDALPTAALRAAWSALTRDGRDRVVVRSSSAIEDTTASSMAGRFTTVVDVAGWDDFLCAVRTVIDSASAVAATEGVSVDDVPIAVLVQELIVPRLAGVLFGVEPVSGRTDRRAIAVVRGLPEHLVGGTVTGSRYETDTRGRRRGYDPGDLGVKISFRTRSRLVALGDECAELTGIPQDVEWALAGDGRLVLLQSRPVTTRISGVPGGPVFGPGPVAETFPDPLSRLEQELWAEPLRRALRSVFEILGVASRRRLDRSRLLVVVEGRVAVDLDLLESGDRVHWYALGARVRALRAAWRMGRLRVALVGLGEDEIALADAALLDVPSPTDLTDRQLVAALERFGLALESLHAYEMLMGLVLHPDAARLSASSVALRVLDRARRSGLDEHDIPGLHPVVLALVPPRLGPEIRLPDVALPAWHPGHTARAAVVREALRLRVRWVQEAGARFAWQLAIRLTERGDLATPEAIRDLDLASLEMIVRGLAGSIPHAPPQARPGAVPSEPLPARFRLGDTGRPVPVIDRHPHQGTGGGGGSGRGPVHVGHEPDGDPSSIPDGSVLVVRALDARLAPVLPRLRGLVAETGSVLAHLAILAREASVPLVVGLSGATTRWAEGTVVVVDGTSGEVTPVADEDRARVDADATAGVTAGVGRSR